MRAFVIILPVVCLLLSVESYAAESAGGANVAGPVLDRLAKMGAAEQQAWLARLEQRAAHAAGLTLDPDEAARQQARIAALLHRKLITWQVLREAIDETNTREREAIDLLARRYRSRVLDAVHDQPNVGNQSQTARPALYNDWKAAGGQFDEQDRLIARLEAAIGGARAERIVAMPVKPEITATAKPQAADGRKELATREAAVKTQPTVRPAAGRSADAVQVNLDELAARIAGNNLGFRTLESELDEKGPWNAARLEPLAERLKVLVMRHNDLDLFRQLTPEGNRSSLGRLETPKSAISQLGARIFEARKLASGEDFHGAEAERQAELERLESLSRELAELARK